MDGALGVPRDAAIVVGSVGLGVAAGMDGVEVVVVGVGYGRCGRGGSSSSIWSCSISSNSICSCNSAVLAAEVEARILQ